MPSTCLSVPGECILRKTPTRAPLASGWLPQSSAVTLLSSSLDSFWGLWKDGHCSGVMDGCLGALLVPSTACACCP